MEFKSIEEEVIYQKLLGKSDDPCLNTETAMHSTDTSFTQKTEQHSTIDRSIINQYFTEICQRISAMESCRNNYPEFMMPKPKIYHPIKMIRYIAKKGIKKSVNWCLDAAFERQNDFNSSVLPAIGRLTELQRMEFNCLEENNTALATERLNSLEGKIQVLEQWLIQSALKMESVNESISILQEQGIIQQAQLIKKTDETVQLAKRSLSQSGEDVILAYILNELHIPLKNCSYLDLGANHAKQFSNTYYFYDKGARGVLVEANPALIPELKLYRSEDIIVNCCISNKEGEPVDFYILNGDGLSTPDKKRADEAIALNPNLRIDQVVSVKTMTIDTIIKKYFEKAPLFMNVDLEGDDLAILSSIDWETFRPLMVSIEMIPYRPTLVVGKKDKQVLDFMVKQEYIEYAFTGINSILLDKRQIKDVLL